MERRGLILADTHAWLWWLSGNSDLSSPAREAMDRAFDDGELAVSAISVWEATMLERSGRLELRLPMNDVIAYCERLDGLTLLPITPRIALGSTQVDTPTQDPADRLIAATALQHGATLVTMDERLRNIQTLPSLW